MSMCGRCVSTLSNARLAYVANVDIVDFSHLPCYNAGPTFSLPIVYVDRSGTRQVRGMEWGLKPRFKTDVHLTTNNARVEGIEKSKLYSPLLQKNRCVLIVDAFYEWKSHKQPFLIRFSDAVAQTPIPLTNKRDFVSQPADYSQELPASFLPSGVSPLLMAGLYDEQDSHFSFTVVTMDATGEVAKIHERMPLFLSAEDAGLWLDNAHSFKSIVDDLLSRSVSLSHKLHTVEVAQLVNSIKNQQADCVLPKKDYDQKQFSKGLGRFFTKTASTPSKKQRVCGCCVVCV